VKQKNLLITYLILLLVMAACGGGSLTGQSGSLEATVESSGVFQTREPQPTATPGFITETVDVIADRINVSDVTFLGLTGEDWINLAVSLFMLFIVYLIGSWAASLLRRWGAPYLKDDDSKAILAKVSGTLKWLIVLFALHLSTIRLIFLNAEVKQAIDSTYFVIATLLVTRAVWYLIDIAENEMRVHLRDTGREQDLSPAIVLIVRILRAVLVIAAASIILAHFGINMTAFAALLGVTGLAVSLAARDTIEDGIAGVIILADRPFRIGDRIEVAAANTWGDVVAIGLRTTRIRTRDNRLVIIPNGLIAKNEVINYSYPDPTYRIETQIGLDYDTDIERARQIMYEAVRQVPDVLGNRPVDILYNEMGDSAMIFRVRWWIESYVDTPRVTDRVHTALQLALNNAGIQLPYPTQSIFIRGEPPLQGGGSFVPGEASEDGAE
jgi:MscS family membrane protein